MTDSESDSDSSSSKKPALATPSTSSKKRDATPTSSTKKKEPKKKKSDVNEEVILKFLNDDSDDDEDEEKLISKRKWMMVESKVNGTRYSPAPPTNPSHRYVDRSIDPRDDRPCPVWWKLATSLNTRRKMSEDSEDGGDSKLREFYCSLAREDDDEVMSSQQSTISELTPSTPPAMIGIKQTLILTADKRKAAEKKIRDAGPEGKLVPGTKSKVMFDPPNDARDYGLFKIRPINATGGGKFICANDPNCLRTRSTVMEEIPKCDIHKGGQIGFVLSEFTDDANYKQDVVYHVIASFKFHAGDEEGKTKNALDAMKIQISNQVQQSVWNLYVKQRLDENKPAPKLVEIEGRRRYFDDEDEMMKVHAARQTTTLFKMLLWPDTTIKIICLNTTINFPNGAYRELRDEMDENGLVLKIHDKVKEATGMEKNMEPGLEIPFLIKANPGESLGSLLARGKKMEEIKLAALYFVSNPYIIYAGQAISAYVHSNLNNGQEPVTYYKKNKGDHPDYKIVPVGLVHEDHRYKWEFILHMCALIPSLLKLKNCLNPEDYVDKETKKVAQSHPYCINRSTNSSFVDKKSWGIIHGYLLKKFSVDVYLGSKGI